MGSYWIRVGPKSLYKRQKGTHRDTKKAAK